MIREKKEKTGARKMIKGNYHACIMGPTADPRYVKCYYCPNIQRK